MLILIKVLGKLYLKKKNSKWVGLDLPQVGNFVYIGTSMLFEGVHGQGYRGGMLIHRVTIFNYNLLKESFLFYYPSQGTFNYPLQHTSVFKYVTYFNLVPILYYCPSCLTILSVCSLEYLQPVLFGTKRIHAQ